MKIYVAAKWCDRETVRLIYSRLVAAGHCITLDWTHHENDSLEDKIRWAELDIEGVRQCDCLVAVFQYERHQRGAFMEVGAALAWSKPVIVIGKAENTSTLLHHPLVVKVDNVGECLDFIPKGVTA